MVSMRNISQSGRIHVWIVVLIIAALGIYRCIQAAQVQSWLFAVIGVLFLVTAAAAAAMRSWSRFLIYALSAIFVLDWAWIYIYEIRTGFLGESLRSLPSSQIPILFLPAATTLIVITYCCLVAHRFIRRGSETDSP